MELLALVYLYLNVCAGLQILPEICEKLCEFVSLSLVVFHLEHMKHGTYKYIYMYIYLRDLANAVLACMCFLSFENVYRDVCLNSYFILHLEMKKAFSSFLL